MGANCSIILMFLMFPNVAFQGGKTAKIFIPNRISSPITGTSKPSTCTYREMPERHCQYSKDISPRKLVEVTTTNLLMLKEIQEI